MRQKQLGWSFLLDVDKEQIKKNIDFTLSHFENQLQIFPRKMMVFNIGGQFTVTSKDDVLQRCLQANLMDCRINAYPEYTHYKSVNRTAPSFVFIDLDLSIFNNKIADLVKVKDETLKKMKQKIKGRPTVLWTGGGFHIYQPIKLALADKTENVTLESIDRFSRFIGCCGNDFTTELMRYLSQYFTDNRNDPYHKPSINSCLIRIPGTINSKYGSQVKLVQTWDGNSSAINYILRDFEIYLFEKAKSKSNKGSGNKIKVDRKENGNGALAGRKIFWIEKLLRTSIDDNRYYCLWRILVPYLVNIRCVGSNKELQNILMDWLEGCNSIKKLSFDPKHRIKSILKGVEHYAPISLKNLKDENPSLYYILKQKGCFDKYPKNR